MASSRSAFLTVRGAQAAPVMVDLMLAMGGMLALVSAMGIGRFVYTPILPAMMAELGLSKSAAGLIASANFLGYLFGALLAATPRLPGGQRLWFFAGLTLSAVTTFGMSLTSAMQVFLLLRFLGGVGSAFVLVAGSALVLERLAATGRHGLAAVHFAGVGLGIAVTAVLVEMLRAGGADWRELWRMSGLLAAVVIPVSAWLMPQANGGQRAPRPVAGTADARASGLGALTLCHGLVGFGYVVTATFLVAVVGSSAGARALGAWVWLLVGLSAAPSTLIWGWAGARGGALRAYGPACLLEAAGIAIGGLWPTPAGAAIAALLLGATFMGITALGFTAARSLAPEQQHRSFAVMTAGFGLGQVLGPIVAGYLLDHTGGFALPSLLAATALAASGVLAMSVAAQGVSTVPSASASV